MTQYSLFLALFLVFFCFGNFYNNYFEKNVIYNYLRNLKGKSFSLQCYVCNSDYQKCGTTDNFDGSIRAPSFCYGYCFKIVLFPGDFVIRGCSSLLNTIPNISNITKTKPNAQQCYLDSFNDGFSATVPPAYYCFCDDKDGCNLAYNLTSMWHFSITALVLTILNTKIFSVVKIF